MADEWRTYAIGDIATVVGGSTPSTADPSNFDGDVPWLTPKDLSGPHDRYVSRGERNLSLKGLESCSAQLLPKKAVLLSTRAPIGYVALAKNPIATNQGFRSLVLNPGFDPEFVYYWLKANVDELERHASGSTFKELSGNALKQISIRIPERLEEQRAIAHILGTLDDKIELNQRMNETLEAVAQALFKSWFVDFDPVRAKVAGQNSGLPKHIADRFPDSFEDSELGEIPKGWGVKRLAEVTLQITKGTTPTQEDISSAPITDAQINYLRVNAIAEDGSFLYDKLTKIPESVHKGVLKRSILHANDVVYTIAGTIGRIAVIGDDLLPANTNQAVAIIRPKSEISPSFLVYAMRQQAFQEELHRNIVHAVQANLSLGMISKAKIVLPPEDLFAKIFNPIEKVVQTITASRAQSRTLTSLRDTLLPKLISGELRLKDKDAERIIGRHV